MPISNDPVVAAETRAARERARADALAAWCARFDEWMDDMIQRLFLETSKQLACVESTKAHEIPDQAQHARTLASLERTLERLSHMQSQRASRERKVAMTDDEARAAFKRRLDQLLEPGRDGQADPGDAA